MNPPKFDAPPPGPKYNLGDIVQLETEDIGIIIRDEFAPGGTVGNYDVAIPLFDPDLQSENLTRFSVVRVPKDYIVSTVNKPDAIEYKDYL